MKLSTLKNLFQLSMFNITTNNITILYIYYWVFRDEDNPLWKIKQMLKLGNTTIIAYNAVLETLGLIKIIRNKKGGRGKLNKIIVNDLPASKVREIIKDKDTLLKAAVIRNKKFQGANSKIAIALENRPPVLEDIINNLPAQHHNFHISPKYLKELTILGERVNIATYTKWFTECKLETGKIKSFGLGIFLYPTMITEFENVMKQKKADQEKKKISKKWDSKNDDGLRTLRELEEEMNAARKNDKTKTNRSKGGTRRRV